MVPLESQSNILIVRLHTYIGARVGNLDMDGVSLFDGTETISSRLGVGVAQGLGNGTHVNLKNVRICLSSGSRV